MNLILSLMADCVSFFVLLAIFSGRRMVRLFEFH